MTPPVGACIRKEISQNRGKYLILLNIAKTFVSFDIRWIDSGEGKRAAQWHRQVRVPSPDSAAALNCQRPGTRRSKPYEEGSRARVRPLAHSSIKCHAPDAA